MLANGPHHNGQAILSPEEAAFYRQAMQVLDEAEIPFLVAGAYAFACYTSIERHTKDFDLFIRRAHLDRALATLQAAGFHTEITFPHWLAKVRSGVAVIDLIFSSGNGVSVVDDAWFDRAHSGEVLGQEVLLCPPEEILWTKAFIMERERFDGADVAHLLHACEARLDWDHLLDRFGAHWHVLLSHLILFRFIYPSDRDRIPNAVMETLLERLEDEQCQPPAEERVCRGTLLSRAQYLPDVQEWDYRDARLHLQNAMTADDIAAWTRAIEGEE